MRSGSGLLRWFCSVVVPIDIKGCKWIWYLTIWPTLPQAPQEKKLDRDSNSQQVQWTGMVRSSSSDVRYFLSRDLTFFDFECNPQGDGLCLFTVNVMKMILCYFMISSQSQCLTSFEESLICICVRGPSYEWAPAQRTDVWRVQPCAQESVLGLPPNPWLRQCWVNGAWIWLESQSECLLRVFCSRCCWLSHLYLWFGCGCAFPFLWATVGVQCWAL